MNAPATAVELSPPTIPAPASIDLALDAIVASKTNPRKRFDAAELAELTASVKAHGVLQPILVRATSDTPSALRPYEIVAGERRYRAAKAAGLVSIPAIARGLSDVQVLEIQCIENLQRADLHPLEEAEGYEKLLKCKTPDGKPYNADLIADKLGKSRAYVFARLKLLALDEKARQAFYDDKLNVSTALLLARIPTRPLQLEALKEIIQPQWGRGEPLSYREAAKHVHEKYTLRLADAPFAPRDDKLLASAGACTTCPKRTGNQPELFADIKSADVCTDPACFDAKKAAHVIRLRGAAEERGQKVISGKEAKKIAPHGHVIDDDYIELDERNHHDSKSRTNRDLLGKGCPTPALLDLGNGKLIEVVSVKTLSEDLRTKLKASATPQRDTYSEDQKKREAKAKLETAVRNAIFEAIVAKHTGTMTPADAALIAAELFERADHDVVKRLLKRWEPEAFAKAKEHQVYEIKKQFVKRIATLAPIDLVRLMVELALAPEVHVGMYSGGGKPEQLITTAERLEIDHAAIRRELTATANAKQRTKTAKQAAKKPAAKPRATTKAKKEKA